MLGACYSLSSRSTTKHVKGVGAYRTFLVFCFTAQRMVYGDLTPFTPKKKCGPSHRREGGGEEAGREGLVSTPKLVCVTTLMAALGSRPRGGYERGEPRACWDRVNMGDVNTALGSVEAGPSPASRGGGLLSLVKLCEDRPPPLTPSSWK